MNLPISPMCALAQATLPKGRGWAFEPKWDGFRAIAWSGGRLDSRRQRSLLRFFPELAAALADPPPDTVWDGEIIVPIAGVYDFEALQRRVNVSATRSRELTTEIPASFAAPQGSGPAGTRAMRSAFAGRPWSRHDLEQADPDAIPPNMGSDQFRGSNRFKARTEFCPSTAA